jgi:2-isopropylmalate synthase
MTNTILYDTTLRDGTQREGISLSVQDKLVIAKKLDALGISYIEGGWPGSNPKDVQFFQEAKKLPFFNKKITAFTSTRYKNSKTATDPNVLAVLATGVKTVTLVGKTWDLHVKKALETTLEENLLMISETIAFFKKKGLRVFYDAEHAFDGMRANIKYALQTFRTADKAGADCIILCDTNGGSIPENIEEQIRIVQKEVTTPLGIHAHNDGEFAVANSFVAYKLGVKHIQGTINGFGERCGNVNLCSIIANLKLKYGDDCITDKQLSNLTEVSRFVSELANIPHDNHLPYVGKSAFAHKGGIHASAMAKDSRTYQHIDPIVVGNSSRNVISELAGRSNIIAKAKTLGLALSPAEAKSVLATVKSLENKGFQFENADASFEMLLRRNQAGYEAPFTIIDYLVLVEQRGRPEVLSEAMVKLKVKGKLLHTVVDGNGPVNALDCAIRKALARVYPAIASIELLDYKVRILNEADGTEAQVRVLVESGNATKRWTTVGSSTNIIEASLFALLDSLEYGLIYSKV